MNDLQTIIINNNFIKWSFYEKKVFPTVVYFENKKQIKYSSSTTV